MRQVTNIVAMATFCIAAPAMAAPDQVVFKKQLDSFVEAELRAQKVPGAAIAVLRKGEIVVAKGFGKANVEHDVPVTPNTIFQSGSVGKMFTSAAVMTEVERGTIRLDDPISKYLPAVPAAWRPITIRHLLTHTSGIPNFESGFDLHRDYSDDELLKHSYTLPLEFKPGARWNYSNTGYVLLGFILHNATGKTYLDILDTRVFKPLGMKTARGISDADIVPNRAAGYEMHDGELKNQDWVSPTMNITADGALYLSLNDMIAWARGVEKGAVLSSGSWEQTYAPAVLNSGKTYPYGFAWMLGQAAGHPRLYHSGSWQGFTTFYSRYLGDDLQIILLTNSSNTRLETIVDGIAKLWDPALVARGPLPAPEPAAERRMTALIEAVRSGKLRAQDVPLAGSGFAEEANEYFATKLKTLGPLNGLKLVKRQELGDDIVYTYAATFGDRKMTAEFGIGPGEQVSSLMIDDDAAAGDAE